MPSYVCVYVFVFGGCAITRTGIEPMSAKMYLTDTAFRLAICRQPTLYGQ